MNPSPPTPSIETIIWALKRPLYRTSQIHWCIACLSDARCQREVRGVGSSDKALVYRSAREYVYNCAGYNVHASAQGHAGQTE